MATQYQVIPPEANLRSQPLLLPRTILARLRQGQRVEDVPAPAASPRAGGGCGPTGKVRQWRAT